jgi:hypothetical protein
MKRTWPLLPLALPVALYAWEALASLIYCALTNRIALWVFPYAQWWTVTAGWHANWLMPILITGSGVAALLPFILVALLFREGRQARTLYGASRWASPENMQQGGIQLRRRS